MAEQPAQQEEIQEDIGIDLPVEAENDVPSEEVKELSDQENEQSEDNNTDKTPNQKKHINRALIFVMSGLHQGAGHAIYEETTIGSGFDNDLIITDADIVDTHLILTPVEKGIEYGIQVTCKGDNLIIDGEILLTTEQNILMKETFVITLGEVNINVTLYKASKHQIAYQKYLAPHIQTFNEISDKTKEYCAPEKILSDKRNIALIAFSVIFMIIIGVFIYSKMDRKTPIQIEHERFRKIKSLTLKEKNNLDVIQKQAHKDLLHVLQKYDLKERLKILNKQGAIFIEGELNNYEFQEWGKVLNWFDTTYGAHINLIPMIQVNNGARRTISFKAVVSEGSMPYVVSWNGDRYRVGATLPGGWIILDITDQGVAVRDAVNNRNLLVEFIRASSGSPVPKFDG